jgi:retinol-binding protein 3
MLRPRALPALLLLLVPAASPARGQPRPDQPDRTIDAAARTAVIDGVLKRLNESYVFPDVAKQMEQAVRDRAAKKEYDDITSAAGLSRKLTDDLRAVCKDKHLRVVYSHEPLPKVGSGPSRAEQERMQRMGAWNNHGFEKVERLAGNVGYLDLRGFHNPESASETAVAAMNFLANSDALIIDLRQNGGGSPAMVALLCSYLFDSRPVHLNDIYNRTEDSTHQWWTLPFVPGKRFVGKDVYVLTSNRTFSAAEEFTYNLKNLKRATVVGETTGGGAHPVTFRPVNEHFGVGVPFARAINPISKTNWEGTGVEPHVAVPAARALKTAHLKAVEKLIAKKPDEPVLRRLKEVAAELRKEPATARKD